MNQQKIRELAGRSGGHFYFESLASRPAQKREGVSFTFEQLEAFAKLVAAKYEQKIQDLEDMITELQERQE
jgi:thymidylate synthase ThyX